MKSFIKCINVNFEESRIEEFDGEKQHPGPRETESQVNLSIRSVA